MKFELRREELVRMWTRDYCTVEADTLKEAIEKVKNYEEDIVECEYLYETVEVLPPVNESTFEIRDSDDCLLYSNYK